MFERKVVVINGEAVKSEGLPANVKNKIEKVIGLNNEFTHWSFEELISGVNTSAERARITVMLKGWTTTGCLRKVRVDDSRKGRSRTVYVAQRLPLSYSTKPRGDVELSPPEEDIDSIFFNLGKKENEKVDLQRARLASRRPAKTFTGRKKAASVNPNVPRTR